MGGSRHHIMHEAASHNSRAESRYLRNQPTLIPRIDRLAHNEIHDVCPAVPLLGSYALQSVVRTFEPGRDTFESVSNLLSSIELASRHPKSHRIETELAQLSIQAIEMQMPFIKDALGYSRQATYIDLAS